MGRGRRRGRGMGAAGHRAGKGSRTANLPCAEMETFVGSTSNTGADFSILSLYRISGGIIPGRLPRTNGSKCQLGSLNLIMEDKLNKHKYRMHMCHIFGVLPEVVVFPGVFMAMPAHWVITAP